MRDKIEKIVNRMKKDLNPDKVNIKYTKSGEQIKLLKNDSCISVDKNKNLTIRLSSSNDSTAVAILAFALQLIGSRGKRRMAETISDYLDLCEEDEEDELMEKPDMFGGIPTVVHATYVPPGEYVYELFDEIPTLPGIRNIKIVIEEEIQNG